MEGLLLLPLFRQVVGLKTRSICPISEIPQLS